jgi:hypothetical protein
VARDIGVPQRIDTNEPKGPEIGAGSAQFRKRVLDLAIARQSVELQFAGKWLWAVKTVGADAVCDVWFNDPSGESVEFKLGLMIAHKPFHRLFITNAAQPGLSITFHTSMDYIEIANSSPTISGDLNPPSYLDPVHRSTTLVAAAAAAIVSPANVDKRKVKVLALNTNTGGVYIGGAGVTAANGYGPLFAGDSMELETAGNVYAFSAAADTVRVLESVL